MTKAVNLKTRILIVEDQFIEANNLKQILKQAGYDVSGMAQSVYEALDLIDRDMPDMVLLDIFLAGPRNGIELAATLHQKQIPFVYLSANSDRVILDQAKKTKPYGFLVKPFRKKDVLVMLEIAWYLHQNREFPSPAEIIREDLPTEIIGNSPGIKEVIKKINIVGPSNISALILGDSGTGKELVAAGIHQASPRKDRPLVTVNCAALPADLIESELFGHEKGAFTGAIDKRIGKFEQADGGTIFLDEIGELSPNLQAKFLRVLQEKEIEPVGGRKKRIDVRILAATNRNLEEEIATGNFRMDLFYRLSIFPIVIPPLYDRKEDIPLLANYFLRKYALQERKIIKGFTDAVISSLQEYTWPGNIRELENYVARSVLLATSPEIASIDLPRSGVIKAPASGTKEIKSMSDQEREHILQALATCNWKLSGEGGAAELLEVNASTLRSRMKKLGIGKKTS